MKQPINIGYIICESAIPGFTETNIVKEYYRQPMKRIEMEDFMLQKNYSLS